MATTTTSGTTRSLLRKLGILPPSLGASAQTSNAGSSPAVLTEIELQHKHITGAEARKLSAALRMNGTITCVKVGCNELRDEGAEAVALAVENHASLTTLDLGFNSIGDRGAIALGKSLCNNCRLRTLYLSGNLIRETGARAIARALAQNRTLTVLHLTGNSIGPEGAHALAEGIVVNKTLTKLYLAGNSIGPRGSAQLFAALACNQGLRSLYLSDNHIGDQGAYALAHALQTNRSLSVLELGFNQITHVGLGYLTSTLTNYHAMQALHLDNNMLGDRGAELVANAIRTMSLELLDVGFNGISTTGVRPLMRSLGCHSTIRSFTLSGNGLDTEGARAVASALGTNTSLRELYLDHTSIGHAGERLICMGLESSPALHLHVLTGFRLGLTYTRMGFPPEMETLGNEQILTFLRDRRASTPPCVDPPLAPICPTSSNGHLLIAPLTPAADSLGLVSPLHCRPSSSSSTTLAVGCTTHPFPVPSAHLQALAEIATRPFDAAELFTLHQYYFSPPAVGTQPNRQTAKLQQQQQHTHSQQQMQQMMMMPPPQPLIIQPVVDPNNSAAAAALLCASGPRQPVLRPVDSEEHLPPCKRQCNNLTTTPITYYPRLKARLESLLKSGSSSHEALSLLRQLRYLETLAQSTSGILTSGADVETTLLDLV